MEIHNENPFSNWLDGKFYEFSEKELINLINRIAKMNNLTKYEQVIHEHICLYVYSIRLGKFRKFNDVRLVKNTVIPNNPLYYILHYSSRNEHNTEYIVLPDEGKVQHSDGGTFKVWFAEANDSTAVNLLLDAIDIYTEGKIKKASNTIAEMQNYRNLARKELDFMM